MNSYMNPSSTQSSHSWEYQALRLGWCVFYRDIFVLFTVLTVVTNLWNFTPKAIAQPALLLSSEDEQYNLASNIAIYEDKTARLTVADLTKPDFTGFSPLGKISLSVGYTHSAYWLTFRVVAPPHRPCDWLLEVGYPNLHRLELYIVRKGKNAVVKRGGAFEPFEQREWISPNYIFALDDSARNGHTSSFADTLTCYLRVQTESAMIVPLKVYTPRAFERLTVVEYLLYDFMYGVMVSMAVYNLFLAISVRERFYLYYVCYVLFFLSADIAIKGLGAVFLQSPQIHWIRILPFFMPISSLCAVLFARSFLRPIEYSPTTDKVLRGAVVFHLLVLGLTFVAPYSVMAQAIAIMIGVVSTMLIIVGIISLRSGYRPARFFVAGWSVFLTATILRSASTVGIMPFTWWADHIPLAGAALETLLLSFALADRINLLKRQQAEVLERAVETRTTELKDANAALEEANRFKTQMLSIAAHDLKNPLAQIIGYADLAEMELAEVTRTNGKLSNTDNISFMLSNLHRSAAGMLNLVKNILDSASMELGKIRIVSESFSLTSLLMNICSSYLHETSQKEQTILTEIDNSLQMNGDEARLRQVFDNLLSNAIKYSPLGKQIWIRARISGNIVRVEVQDEGPGLTEEDKTKLFGFFQRLSAQPTGGESSNGVGLAIVKKIVELHEGRIWVESEPGRGATFVVELPIGHL